MQVHQRQVQPHGPHFCVLCNLPAATSWPLGLLGPWSDAAWPGLQAQRRCGRQTGQSTLPFEVSFEHKGAEKTVSCGKTSFLVCMPAGGREYQQDRHVEDEGVSAVSGHHADICLGKHSVQAVVGKLICVAKPTAQHQTASSCSADFMKSVDNVPRSLACIFDGHKTEEAAELAANNMASVLQTREGMTGRLHVSQSLISAGTPLLHIAGQKCPIEADACVCYHHACPT